MNSSNLIDILKDGNIIIPLFFLKKIKKLKLELDEFIILMYLYMYKNNIQFNPEKISSDLGLELSEVMVLISNITDKGFISVEVKKNEKGYMEDTISLDGFYNKLKLLFVDDFNKKRNDEINNSTIYEIIEQEFGRTLSSMEFEIIRAWLDSNISEELIKEALKEAVFNGVSNLKYIDKILYEWGKNNIKTIEDVEKARKKRQNKKEISDSKNTDLDMDIMDWNWWSMHIRRRLTV